MASIAVNGTNLYYERRGTGPPVLFVSGATGDAGHWTAVAGLLADEYTVLTYDRRANSRSPRPAGWTATSVDEQADDAAALLTALDLAPAVAYGNSSGAVIVTNLVLRHPAVLRGAILREPSFLGITPASREVAGTVRRVVGEGMAAGGPPVATERFLRWATGDAAFEGLDPELRDRMLGNGDVLFGVELEGFAAYLPTPEQLAGVGVPCVVAAGVDNRDPTAANHWLHETSQWLADCVDVPLVETPGAHSPQVTHPRALAEALRPILGKLAARP
ncbi:alpha/beta hydrolase [Pseudonocardia zijingensis]|uniref:Alpha/beta hydrolase n=1 Tax=Pseudonocardia zijingensis TaxID=153376 RepID=A0ABN1PSF7_9PSEU